MVQEVGLDKLIRDHPFFEGMDDEALELIAGCAANERFDAGQYVFREGQPADKFYMVRHGSVALEVRAPGRDSIVLQSCDDGDVMGWSWIVPPFRWKWDARATRLSRLVSFDAICLRGKLDADPALGYAVYKRFVRVIAERLAHARLQMLDLYGIGKE
ncbi:MAG: cyclic nucleotide-binding domain-containing protein [Rhodospirillales bacterium]|jgi:CRP/FNR family transcriptional regulator, cyclic AMP receptor protein|nr:cyclic nucleotide-binding domain-containing protein [Rhodospirillales bacterium]